MPRPIHTGGLYCECSLITRSQMHLVKATSNGFQGGLQIGGRMITNLCYANDIILLATSEAELQELVDHLDRVSRKYSLLINVDKTRVMASDGIACHILIQNELLEQADTFPYLRSLITEDGECTTEFRTRLNRGQAIGVSLQSADNMEKSQYTDFIGAWLTALTGLYN